MKPLRIRPGLSVPLLALIFLCGCHKKPVQTTATAQPPAASPTPAAQEPTQAPQPAEAAQPAQETPTEQAQSDQKKPDKKPLRHKPHPVAKKPAASPTPQEKPAAAGGGQEARNMPSAKPYPAVAPAPSPISPAPVTADATRDQVATDQLLQTAENKLNGIKRQLSKDEEDMVTQIKAFITQSRDATKNNDQVRAHNLAVKAQLLSDALAKPK